MEVFLESYLIIFFPEIDLNNVQDAFVIAVEPQARKRLERLATLYKIQPVDMAKLCQQVSTIYKCFLHFSYCKLSFEKLNAILPPIFNN